MFVLAGYGFVGKAYYELFSQEYDVEIVDPLYTSAIISDFPYAAGIICCVGTPQAADGNYNLTALHDVISRSAKSTPILIKSTITVDIWDELKAKFPQHNLTFSPEFLRANSAVQDVFASRYVILAGDSTTYWSSIFQTLLTNAAVFVAEPEEAIVAKQFINAFLATKVSFFNQLYDYCESVDIDYSAVRELILLDKRIGSSHTKINSSPRGWGGYCFPKDTAALLAAATSKEVDLSVLQSAVSYNDKIKKL
jgi:UDPglucose 6-dehydrogenase